MFPFSVGRPEPPKFLHLAVASFSEPIQYALNVLPAVMRNGMTGDEVVNSSLAIHIVTDHDDCFAVSCDSTF